ncbi:MAG: hypothetical protein ACLFWD_09765, partial [Anaerolineales bacterium]
VTSAPARRDPTRQAPTRERPIPNQTRPQTTRPPRRASKPNAHTASTDETIIAGTGKRNYHDVDQYLERIQGKINKLAEEFANGSINREQFQRLFEHYQRERTAIQNWKESTESAGNWQDISNEGKSIVIRSKHTAKVLGYAIYVNDSGMPLTTIGDFELDPDLAVPMLSSYRSATKEIFGGEMRSTEIEGGNWLCFVPGEDTTMLALFTREPAARQLSIMEDLHRLFEKANRRHLAQDPINPGVLAFPHSSYLGRLQ